MLLIKEDKYSGKVASWQSAEEKRRMISYLMLFSFFAANYSNFTKNKFLIREIGEIRGRDKEYALTLEKRRGCGVAKRQSGVKWRG